jgi:hypothetical protein
MIDSGFLTITRDVDTVSQYTLQQDTHVVDFLLRSWRGCAKETGSTTTGFFMQQNQHTKNPHVFANVHNRELPKVVFLSDKYDK